MSLCPGMLVLCIRGGSDRIDAVETFPTAGRVYTIRDVGADRLGQIGVTLEEIVNQARFYLHTDGAVIDGELYFVTSRFRPLDDDRLAVFRRHLAPIVMREFT